MEPFPFSDHTGDRQLAAQLLYEHGLDASLADIYNPQIIECLAGEGKLANADLFEEEKRWRNDVIDSMGARPRHPPVPKPTNPFGTENIHSK